MAKSKFPDGNDCSANDPCVLLTTADIKKLYKKDKSNSNVNFSMDDSSIIKKFIEKNINTYNWDSYVMFGKQVLLKKYLPVVPQADSEQKLGN